MTVYVYGDEAIWKLDAAAQAAVLPTCCGGSATR